MSRTVVAMLGHTDAGKTTVCAAVLCAATGTGSPAVLRWGGPQDPASLEAAKRMKLTRKELERGITIDMHLYDTFLGYTLVDLPGCKYFVKTAVRGLSLCNLAVLVVAAAAGEFEAEISREGSIKEHLMIAYSFGIRKLIVFVNKMDDRSIATYCRARYDQESLKCIHPFSNKRLQIVAELSTHTKNLGFRAEDTRFLPGSAYQSLNIAKSNVGKSELGWYDGPCLMDLLASHTADINSAIKSSPPSRFPFRMTIARTHHVSHPDGVIVVGKVVSGSIKLGAQVSVGSEPPLIVHSAQNFLDPITTPITSPCCVALALRGRTTEVRTGCILSQHGASRFPQGPNALPLQPAKSFTTNCIFFTSCSYSNLVAGSEMQIYAHSSRATVRIMSVVRRTQGNTVDRPYEVKSIKGVTFELALSVVSRNPFFVERYEDCKALGSVLFRIGRSSIGVGVVTSIFPETLPNFFLPINPRPTMTVKALSRDVLREIFSYFEYWQLLQVFLVCKAWSMMAKDEALWQQVYFRLFKGSKNPGITSPSGGWKNLVKCTIVVKRKRCSKNMSKKLQFALVFRITNRVRSLQIKGADPDDPLFTKTASHP
ncbi:Translation protein, beta-barrel domain [Pelomyxa schiedti]|nr:Translation protein, beta-barrel domain [Pelomyxa schiedti]